jgi:hypothetical protein
MTYYNIPAHISGDTWPGIGQISFNRNNIPIDFTNAFLEMGVKFNSSIANPPVLTLTTLNSGITITNAISGTISILPQIIDIPPGKYNWYLSFTLETGEKKTYLMGQWHILPNIPV